MKMIGVCFRKLNVYIFVYLTKVSLSLSLSLSFSLFLSLSFFLFLSLTHLFHLLLKALGFRFSTKTTKREEEDKEDITVYN